MLITRKICLVFFGCYYPRIRKACNGWNDGSGVPFFACVGYVCWFCCGILGCNIGYFLVWTADFQVFMFNVCLNNPCFLRKHVCVCPINFLLLLFTPLHYGHVYTTNFRLLSPQHYVYVYSTNFCLLYVHIYPTNFHLLFKY